MCNILPNKISRLCVAPMLGTAMLEESASVFIIICRPHRHVVRPLLKYNAFRLHIFKSVELHRIVWFLVFANSVEKTWKIAWNYAFTRKIFKFGAIWLWKKNFSAVVDWLNFVKFGKTRTAGRDLVSDRDIHKTWCRFYKVLSSTASLFIWTFMLSIFQRAERNGLPWCVRLQAQQKVHTLLQ